MRKTLSFFINGELVYVPEDELEQFYAKCEETGVSYEPADVFSATNANGETEEFSVPRSQQEQFMETAKASGGNATPMQALTMDDGSMLTLRDEDIRQYVQARRTGQTMSRGLMAGAGIPDWYGKSRADREALADRLGALYYPEDTVVTENEGVGYEENAGDRASRTIANVGRKVSDAVANSELAQGAIGAAKGFGEGLVRSVTDPAALYEETYGDGIVKNALLGGQDFANTVTRGGMDVASKALGGRDSAVGRTIREAENALPTEQAEVGYGDETVDPAIGFLNDFSKGTLSTLMKYAAPGVAAVDIAGSVVDNYYDSYDRAIRGGASADKANALASAAAGIGAAEGIWLAQSAAGGKTAGAFKDGFKRILGMGGKMGVAAGARDIVEQGIEGAENPDLARTGVEAAKAAGEGALFEATSMGTHALARTGERSVAREAEKARQERVAEAAKENARAEARTRYEADLSEEALADIERNVNEMVKSEVIPSYRQAEEVAKRAREKLTRETGESAEAVQQAVMEAAQEVSERLQTPSRVTSPALERRQTEAQMRENERQTRLAEDYAANEAERTRRETERKGAEINADLDAQRAAYEKREKDIKAAFERGDGELVKKLMEEQRAEMDAYLKADEARKAREAESEASSENVRPDEPTSASAMNQEYDQLPTRENRRTFSPEYDEWIRKGGKADTDKNWNRFVAENDLPESWKMRDAEKDARIADVKKAEAEAIEMGNRIESEGEMQRAESALREQDEYDARMTAREEKKGAEGHARRTAEVAADWDAAVADRKAREAERKAEKKRIDEEYARKEAERKAREAEEEATLQPQEMTIRVNEAVGEAKQKTDPRDAQWPEYVRWREKNGRANNAKSWNKFVMENELDPSLRMDTKDQSAYDELMARHEERKAGAEAPVRKPYDYGDEAGSAEEAKWAMARQTKERVMKQHPEMSEEEFNARWNGIEHTYRKQVEEWETRKADAQKRGDKFVEPMPKAEQMEFDFNTENKVDTTPKMAVETPTAAKSAEPAPRVPDGKEASKRYYEIADESPSERNDMRRLDPALRSDPKVVAWAQKKGRTVSDGMVTPDARREYDAEQAKGAAKAAKRWFPDMKVTYHDYGENIQRGQHVIDLRDTSGNALGYFDPNSKEVHLLPGANAETVAHEIMWHGTRDWATTEAAKGNERAKALLARMKKVEQEAPEALKNKVTRLYRANGVSNADVLFNEWGAWFTMGKGGKALEEAMATKEGRNWFAKSLATVKDAYKDLLSAHGGNRADLSEIDAMDRDTFVDFISKQFAGGKTLGEIGANKGTGKVVSTEETAWQAARRRSYDSVAAVRDVERDVEKKTGVKIKTEDSVDAALALRPGEHEAVAINQKRVLGEVKKMLKDSGISSEDLGYYMSLKAAAGRDAKIDAKRLAQAREDVVKSLRTEWQGREYSPEEFEAEAERRFADVKADYESSNGSHIDPREAQRMIAELENGSNGEKYKRLKAEIDKIQNETMQTYVEAGLISKADAERLRKEEPDYVPFKSDFDESGEFVGRGYNASLAKKTFYEAKGRKSAAGDILAHILNDSAMAQNKAIENKARAKLAKLVEANPELGTVTALGNRQIREARRGQGGDKNVILFKRDGQTFAIELNGTRGEAMAAAFTGANQVKAPGWVQKASRAWAATATELSPTFAIRNVTKDNIELAENAIKDMGSVKGAKFIAKYAANQAKSAPALLKYVTTGKIDTTTETGRQLQSFIDNGGMIGGFGTEGYSDISRALSSEQIAKEMKRGTNAAKAAAMHTLHSVAYLNKMSEMTSRFNAFRTQVEMGMSPKEAALWSRRTLTDFNRKGDWTGVTNVVRMFSNSTLGATAKAATGLMTTKGGLTITAGLLVNGAAQAIIEHYANAEEDEKNRKLGKGTGADVSEYDRKTSFWLNRNAKDGKITKVGSHEGPFQLINYVGNCAARVALGDMTSRQMAKELGLSVAELASAFSGWGSVNFDSQEEGATGAIKAFVASAMPSVTQPLFEIGTNTDYAGRKVFTEKGPSDDSPYYTRARRNTPEWAKKASEAMNNATGGNEARTGVVDVPAEVVQKIVESFGKNAAKDVITAYETGKAIANGNFGELESRMVPVKRDFVRDTADSTSRYFDAKRIFEKDDSEFKKRMASMTSDERKAYIKERPWVARSKQVNAIVNRIDDLRHYEKSEMKSGRGYRAMKTGLPKERVEAFKAERQRLQAKLLEIMGR